MIDERGMSDEWVGLLADVEVSLLAYANILAPSKIDF